MSPHYLHLTIGSWVVQQLNLNTPRLCNGTRLIIKRTTGKLLEENILTAEIKGEIGSGVKESVTTYSTDTVRMSNTIQKASIPDSFGFHDDHK
ncbi:hypothetical protein TNCV_2251241 [Trichonephila clavipes]|nr:hypothetical protein TNCV_2251241 [Trichonephila clavipes]